MREALDETGSEGAGAGTILGPVCAAARPLV